tara:strand:+ start:437 stop:859 length:423 start_codon:yes stop_codon:yes gene_type:complete
MASTMCVRMKLSDFIDTDIESDVMEMMDKTHTDLKTTIFLNLWYENDEISSSNLKDFLIRWEDKLHFRTKVTQNSEVPHGEFIFYDIVPKGYKDNQRYRFKYEYVSNSKIIDGLKQLYDCLKFITSDKPNKRQKRNDYED